MVRRCWTFERGPLESPGLSRLCPFLSLGLRGAPAGTMLLVWTPIPVWLAAVIVAARKVWWTP